MGLQAPRGGALRCVSSELLQMDRVVGRVRWSLSRSVKHAARIRQRLNC